MPAAAFLRSLLQHTTRKTHDNKTQKKLKRNVSSYMREAQGAYLSTYHPAEDRLSSNIPRMRRGAGVSLHTQGRARAMGLMRFRVSGLT